MILPFYLTEKHQNCFVSKTCVKKYLEIFLNYPELCIHAEKDHLCFYEKLYKSNFYFNKSQSSLL